MELFETIAKRYCHKVAFDPQSSVPDPDLRRIVEAGMAAPSAGNGQSPEFVIVNDKATLQRIGELTQNTPLRTTPAMIAVLSHADMRTTPDQVHGECLIADYAVATLNMLLAATALGYACGWVDGIFQNQTLTQQVSNLLGIPQDRLLVLMVPVGLPGEPGPRRPKKPFEQRASWNRYQVNR